MSFEGDLCGITKVGGSDYFYRSGDRVLQKSPPEDVSAKLRAGSEAYARHRACDDASGVSTMARVLAEGDACCRGGA
ncbi:hypothetical protein HZA40_01995 [Candidatus Peregrinibacteria bacterium]|nr:hypothetical protein [Candidatus Peregrinibacteria bacterium]